MNREGYLQGKLKNALIEIKATIKINFILSRLVTLPAAVLVILMKR